MEKQIRAVREKRANIAESEGEKQKRINEAIGRAEEIERVAAAKAKEIRETAAEINEESGLNAVNLRVSEQYISEFWKLAKTNNSMIILSDLSDFTGMISTAMTVIKDQSQ